MDSDLIKKRLTEELTFLNEEVAKTKEVKLQLEKQIEDMESEYDKVEQELVFSTSAFALRTEKQDKEIESNEKKLDEFRSELSKLDKELEDKQGELLDANAQLEKSILANGELIKKQIERDANATAYSKELEKLGKQLYLKQTENEAKEKLLDNKDKNLAEEYSKIEASKAELESLKKQEKDKILLADRIINTNSNKENELKARETQLQVGKNEVAAQKVELEKYRTVVEEKEKLLRSRESIVSGKETDTNKKEKAVIDREAAVLLREAECRVREKALNIANREKQLDEKI